MVNKALTAISNQQFEKVVLARKTTLTLDQTLSSARLPANDLSDNFLLNKQGSNPLNNMKAAVKPFTDRLNTNQSDTIINKQNIFEYEVIDCMIKKHLSNKVDYSWHLWNLIVFQHWFRKYFL